MKIFNITLSFFLLTLLLWATPITQGVLELAPLNSEVRQGEVLHLEIKVSDFPSVYGVELAFQFDPIFWEVLDADQSKPGVQIEPGEFIDPAQGFAIQNMVDNKKGQVNYMMTLLNPAKPSEGEGILIRTQLKAKKVGQSKLILQKSKFGTPEGKVIQPKSKESLEIKIIESSAELKESSKESKKEDNPLVMVVIALSLALIINLIYLAITKMKASKRN